MFLMEHLLRRNETVRFMSDSVEMLGTVVRFGVKNESRLSFLRWDFVDVVRLTSFSESTLSLAASCKFSHISLVQLNQVVRTR